MSPPTTIAINLSEISPKSKVEGKKVEIPMQSSEFRVGDSGECEGVFLDQWTQICVTTSCLLESDYSELGIMHWNL